MEKSSLESCRIPEFWCGDKDHPKDDGTDLVYYNRNGSRYECLKRGIGVGKYMDKKIPTSSLRNIKYVGETYEKNFAQVGIHTLKALYKASSNPRFGSILKRVCTKKDGVLDKKAHNSVIWHIKKMKYKTSATCVKI